MRLKSKEDNRVRQIPLVQISPGKTQPRKNFSNEELIGLAKSIQENGVLQPLTVRKMGLNGFELIAGERRMRAAVKESPAWSLSATTSRRQFIPCWKIFSGWI